MGPGLLAVVIPGMQADAATAFSDLVSPDKEVEDARVHE